MQAARAKAEELMEQAIENELAIKSQLDMEHRRLSQVESDIELERETVCSSTKHLYAVPWIQPMPAAL